MAAVTESKYKSFMKPVKFWQKSSQPKEVVHEEDTQQEQEEIEQEQRPVTTHKSSSYMPSFSFSRKSTSPATFPPVVALTESGKTEVYKLSTIDHDGLYVPPSPTLGGKRDHWIEVNEDIMDFRLPSSECLTTHVGEKHDFFTPSTFVQTQPYIFPIASHMSDSALSSVPSFVEDDGSDIMTSSCRSSASYL
ncbi:unnamed protein product [Mucor hiemalis]